MTSEYKYETIGAVSDADSNNVTLQGCVCDIYDLPKDLGFCLVIYDKASAKEQCNEIQCYFWRNQALKYSKQMFKRNKIYDFINPNIVQSNSRYHKHKYKIYIHSQTNIVEKPSFNLKKAHLTCVETNIKKKKSKRKQKLTTNNHKITNYFNQTIVKSQTNKPKNGKNKNGKNKNVKNKTKESYQSTMDNWVKRN